LEAVMVALLLHVRVGVVHGFGLLFCCRGAGGFIAVVG